METRGEKSQLEESGGWYEGMEEVMEGEGRDCLWWMKENRGGLDALKAEEMARGIRDSSEETDWQEEEAEAEERGREKLEGKGGKQKER